MNDLKIFENEEFGKVRTMIINDEPWFVGKDVATILGYTKTRNALSQHVDDDDSLKQGLTDSLGRTQDSIFINESGLYSLILSSKLESAKKFKRWITSDVIPTIRKTGSYSNMSTLDQIKLIAQGNIELNSRIDKVESEIEEFKETMPLLAIDCEQITNEVKKRGTELLGGKDSNSYRNKSLRQRVYSDIYRELKRQFGVTSYKSIQRNMVSKAVDFLKSYNIPYVLKDEVVMNNNQLTFSDIS